MRRWHGRNVIPSESEGPVWVGGAMLWLRTKPSHTDPSLSLGMTRKFFIRHSHSEF
jgi:hypothetical protein